MEFHDTFGATLPRFLDNAGATRRQPVGRYVKRVFDIFGSLSMLIALAPMLIILAVMVKVEDGGPILFRHRRLGYRGQTFQCLKFRSMAPNAPQLLADLFERDPAAAAEWEETHKLKRDPRVTRLGAFMRSTSLDELPQLLNVLTGEMSLVGPRPVVQAEVDRYGDKWAFYAAARPGITGLWQVSGRSDTSYADRVQHDIDYVSNWTLARDLTILLKTPSVVFLRAGSY
jgi:Undecaprenyl-phosphate galactose phosphotransferase WbaP